MPLIGSSVAAGFDDGCEAYGEESPAWRRILRQSNAPTPTARTVATTSTSPLRANPSPLWLLKAGWTPVAPARRRPPLR
jgi:hypothetical protein